jgi:hypothetical protein
MNHKTTKQLLIIFIWILALIACNPQSKELPIYFDISSVTPTSTQNAISTQLTDQMPINGCIPPLKTFVYKTRKDPTTLRPGQDLIVPPPSPWRVETELPLLEMKGYVLAARVVDGDTEIWTTFVSSGDHLEYSKSFMVYSPDKKVWKEISAQVGDDDKVFVDNSSLFVGRDSSLWGENFWPDKADLLQAYPLLSKYNEKTGKFEFKKDTKEIPAGWHHEDGFRTVVDKILLGPDGIFWFLVYKDAIYSYSPVTREVKRHVEIPDYEIRYATIAPDGKIYYVIVTPPELNKQLFSFDPKNDKIIPIDLTYSVYDAYLPNVFADHLGRLWLGGLGWRDPNESTWYRLHPSPIFIGKSTEDIGVYWENPFIFMESSDGRLWFHSNNGLAWLDLQKEEWCWFTTYQSNIVEDAQHILWMIADGNLYKYPLKP